MYRNGKIKPNWCPNCRVLQEYCFCSQIPKLDTKLRLMLVIQIRELFLASNSGLLASKMLTNSEVRIRGDQYEQLSFEDIDFAKYNYLYLFPSENSVPLKKELIELDSRPPILVVPDGSWRACKKIQNRYPNLQQMTCVHLDCAPKSRYYLRKSHLPHGLSTLEAIALSYSELESSTIAEKMLTTFDIMVRIHLKQRQKEHPESNWD